MATNLDPQLLAQILALRQNGQWTGANTGGNLNGVQQWYDPTVEGNNGWRLQYEPGVNYGGPNGSDTLNPALDQNWISKVREDTGGKLGDRWGLDGTYQGTFDAQDGGGRNMNQAIALMAAGYFGGGALNGAEAAGAEAAGLSGWDAAMADLASSGGLTPASMGLGTATTGAATALNGANTLNNAKTAVDGMSTLKSVTDVLGGANTVGGLLGAAAGALSSKDQQQTTSRDPWSEAQPALKGLLAQLPVLQQQYQSQPFNSAQKAGYNNFAGLLDLANQNAGGLLAGFQANASGANQFRRGQPQGLIGSSFSPTAEQWQPQTYGRFGG